MPNWGEVLREIGEIQKSGAVDLIRRKYLKRLHQYTKRNVIAYYSGWLARDPRMPSLNIGDDDKNAFMTAIHGLDRRRGLDLILHTPGGDIAATESLVHYLRAMFDTDIRAIVPQLAMSAGTMIACACREIVMGKESSLGPFDPQIGGIPAQGVIEEFENAIARIKMDPAETPLWQQIISRYHPSFLGECEKAVQWSREIVTEWLKTGMFAAQPDADVRAAKVVGELSSHSNTKTHARHISIDDCTALGLSITRLEDDDRLQDLVLTVHHAFMHTFGQTGAIKIIENHRADAVVLMGAPAPGR